MLVASSSGVPQVMHMLERLYHEDLQVRPRETARRAGEGARCVGEGSLLMQQGGQRPWSEPSARQLPAEPNEAAVMSQLGPLRP